MSEEDISKSRKSSISILSLSDDDNFIPRDLHIADTTDEDDEVPNIVTKMSYGWKNEILLLTSHHWMEYTAFIRVINSFKFKPFSVKAVRDNMRTTLENLQNDIPFSVGSRFPDQKLYIDLHHSVPLQLLKQVALALDISDRQVEKGRHETDTKTDRAYSNFEDAKLAFGSAVSALLDLIGPLPIEAAHIFGVYTRDTFESEHTLKWA